jgi:hypothetical protein
MSVFFMGLCSHLMKIHKKNNSIKYCMSLDQGWATLFGSRATLETKVVYAGHYKNHMDLFDLTFEKKIDFQQSNFKKEHFKRHFQCFVSLKKCSRATLRCSAGRMWPAGRTLPRPGLDSYSISIQNKQ